MELVSEYRALIGTLAGICALLVLILRARLHAFAALLLVAILSALAAGMAPKLAFDTVQKGMGGTLGFIAPVIGLGALFGAILEEWGFHTSRKDVQWIRNSVDVRVQANLLTAVYVRDLMQSKL